MFLLCCIRELDGYFFRLWKRTFDSNHLLICMTALRGRLHVYESVCELMYDSMHDLLRILILYHKPITVCKHILEKIDPEFDCNPP
jgi:hypothetical protein